MDSPLFTTPREKMAPPSLPVVTFSIIWESKSFPKG